MPDLTTTDFSKLSPEQQQELDTFLEEAEGVKRYQESGMMGGAKEWAPHAESLRAVDGMSPQAATFLARYRHFRQGGAERKGLPRAPDTEQEVTDRASTMQSATPEQRANIDAVAKREVSDNPDNYFSALTNRKALAAAHEQERAERTKGIGPPIEGMGSDTPMYAGEQPRVTLGTQSPTPATSGASSDDERLADAQMMMFKQLANTPYSNEQVMSAQNQAAPMPTDEQTMGPNLLEMIKRYSAGQ